MIGDRKTENILSSIKDNSLTLENSKSTQFIGGKSFVTYVTNSDNQYDFSLNVPQAYKAAKITFTFTDNALNKFHIVKPTIYYRIDNPDVMGSPAILSNGTNQIVSFFQDGVAHGVNTYVLQLTNGDAAAHTFYLKYYFYGTTSGTFNTVAL